MSWMLGDVVLFGVGVLGGLRGFFAGLLCLGSQDEPLNCFGISHFRGWTISVYLKSLVGEFLVLRDRLPSL